MEELPKQLGQLIERILEDDLTQARMPKKDTTEIIFSLEEAGYNMEYLVDKYSAIVHNYLIKNGTSQT